MALQPEDEGVFVWPPPHWQALAEYGQTTPVGPGMPAPQPPPPPPPPPPPQRIGPDEQIEETAPPPMAAAPPVQVPPPATDEIEMPPEYVGRMPEVDAVSGVDAGPPPPSPAPVEETPVEGAPTDATYFDALAPATWTKPISSADLYQLAHSDPVAYAQHIAAMDKTAADELQRRETIVKTQNATKEEQNWQDLQDSQAKANEMRDKLLATRIDANRWRNSRTTGQSIAAFLSVVIGGLYQARKGGPNIGLEIIDKAIDRDIAEQTANVDMQRNAIADLRAQGLSDFQAKQAYRVGWYQRALDEVKTSMQDYDPAGTTARNLAQQALEIEARIAQAAEAGRRAKLSEELQRRKDDRETLTTLSELRKRDAETAKLLARTGAGGGVKHPPEYFATLKLPVPPFEMTDKEHAAWMAHQKTAKELSGNDAVSRKQSADAIEAEAKAEAAKSGYAIKNPETGQPFLNKDGKPVVEMSETKRQRVNEVVVAAANMRRLADKITELRKRDGGHWKALGSEDAQEIQSLVSMVDFETFKAFGLGAPSEGDKELAAGARGGVDPSSFVKNASAGFLAYADGLEKKAQTELRSSGYDGPPLKFHRASELPKAKATVTDELLSRAMQTPFIVATPGSPTDAAAAATPAQQKVNHEYETDIKTLAAFAATGNEKEKEAARVDLEKLAKDHPTEAGRVLAAEALKNVPGTAAVRER